MAEISLELFNGRFEQLNEMDRELRNDIHEIRSSLLTVSRQVVNLDRRLSNVKDELEGTIKMELGGAFAHMETRMEQFIERRIAELQNPNQLSED